MANEKIHEYVDQVQLSELIYNEVMIDTEVDDGSGNWLSKKLLARDIISPYIKPHCMGVNLSNLGHSSVNVPKAIAITNFNQNSLFAVNYDGSGNPTILVPYKSGVYKIDVTMQVARTSGGSNQQISAWFKLNQFYDIPWSNVHIDVVANTNLMVVSFSSLIDISAYAGLQIMWSVTDTAIILKSEPNNTSVPHPATPSIRVIITNA